jgi:NAD-dependent SIR2 family protein deacetylase
MRTAIFLGAGASAATQRLSTQATLLKSYFEKTYFARQLAVGSNVRAFFQRVFEVDVYGKEVDLSNLPTFEEILGVIDLAQERGETLAVSGDSTTIVTSSVVEDMASTYGIPAIRLYFILLLAQATDPNSTKYNIAFAKSTIHSGLIDKLQKSGTLSNTFFITTNYDIFAEDGLYKGGFAPYYGPDFRYIPPKAIQMPTAPQELQDTLDKRPKIDLFKLHGSLNWLYCPVCRVTRYKLVRPFVLEALGDSWRRVYCETCKSLGRPVIVPPTLFKSRDLTPDPLKQTWERAEKALMETEHLVFCGYSFPDADMHVKFLLKSVQTKRSDRLKVTVLNRTPKSDEEGRYKRFLGANIRYLGIAFDDFASNPMNWLI